MKEKSSSSRRSKCMAFFNKLLFENEGNNELCHVCLAIVEDPVRHARQVHLRQPMYQCPCCSYYSTWNQMQVIIHLTVAHDDPPDCAPVDNSAIYASSLQDWLNKCYGWNEWPIVDTDSLSSNSESDSIVCCYIFITQVIYDRTNFLIFRLIFKTILCMCIYIYI